MPPFLQGFLAPLAWCACQALAAFLASILRPSAPSPSVILPFLVGFLGAAIGGTAALVLGIGALILGFALRPRPKPSPSQKRAHRDLENPTAEAARPIPVAFGTILIKSPNVLAFGDKKRTEKDNRAYYHLSILYGICHGEIDAFLNVKVRGKWIYDSSAAFGEWNPIRPADPRDGSLVRFDDRNLFGGKDREGGISGAGVFHLGSAEQGVSETQVNFLRRLKDDILAASPDADTDFFAEPTIAGEEEAVPPPSVPANRGVATALFTQSGAQIRTERRTVWSPGNPGLGEDAYHEWLQNRRRVTVTRRIVEISAEDGFYWGTSPVLPPVEFLVSRIPKGWKDDKAFIARAGNIKDANPAHMIREILTNDAWGMGADAGEAIDEDSFAACADALHEEGFGLSMGWFEDDTIENFVDEILNHVKAALYVDAESGKFRMKLLRGDYDPESLALPHLDDSNSSIASLSRRAPNEIVNTLNVTWTHLAADTGDSEETSFTIYDDAAYQTFPQSISADENYFGITDESLAREVARRELAESSALLLKGEVEAHRVAADLSPGDVFRLSSDFHGLDGTIMRALKVRRGTAANPKVTIEFIEDIFAVAAPRLSEIAAPAPAPAPAPATAIEARDFRFCEAPAAMADALWERTASVRSATQAIFLPFAATANRSVLDVFWESPATGAGTIPVSPKFEIPERWAAEAETQSLLRGIGYAGSVPGLVDGESESVFCIIGAGDDRRGFASDVDHEWAEIVMQSGGESGVSAPLYTFRRGMFGTFPRQWARGTPVWIVPPASAFDERSLVFMDFGDARAISGVSMRTDYSVYSPPQEFNIEGVDEVQTQYGFIDGYFSTFFQRWRRDAPPPLGKVEIEIFSHTQQRDVVARRVAEQGETITIPAAYRNGTLRFRAHLQFRPEDAAGSDSSLTLHSYGDSVAAAPNEVLALPLARFNGGTWYKLTESGGAWELNDPAPVPAGTAIDFSFRTIRANSPGEYESCWMPFSFRVEVE